MQRPLDPVSLQHFVAVCEEGNIARAAAREAMVASALSKRIAALEAEVGVPLLVRRRRGVEPTPAGQALLVRSREVLASLQQVRTELTGFGAGVQGSVRVLASPSALAERLPDDIAAFVTAHPAIRISLDERMSPAIVRGVRDGSADVGVLWDLIDLSGLHARPYRRDRLCVAMAPTHALARRPVLSFAETLEHASINVSTGGQMDQLLRRQAALLGRLPAYRMQVSSLDAACRLVGAGLGLAILPMESATPHAGAAGRLSLVPLAEPWAVRQFVLVTREVPLVSGAARELVSELAAASAGE